MIRKVKYIVVGMLAPAMFVLPLVALAQTQQNGLSRLVFQVSALIQSVIPIIIGLSILMFLWGIFKFFFLANDDAGRTDGKKFIIWGLIALVVMVSIWGLVNILRSAIIPSDAENNPIPAPIVIPPGPTLNSN